MTRLLVSVRSAEEASEALAGGASILDVKEPTRGPLGRASFETWERVRAATPADVPLSVALGELPEWGPDLAASTPREALADLDFCKVGLAGAGRDWPDRWQALRAALPSASCRWIGVAYLDWESADAPPPSEVVAALAPFVAGVLFDTWSKALPGVWGREAKAAAAQVRERGLLLAVAGSLTGESIATFAGLAPDVIAVRGAACAGGDRLGRLDRRRVAELAEVVRGLSGPGRA